MIWLLGVSLVLLLFGWLAFKRATLLRRESGLPQGRLVYMDTHGQDWQEAPQPLYSATYQLVGKPDYLVETPKGIIPVEVKSSAAPAAVPYLGHLLQLAAYCLLVEETTGCRSPHGLLKYANALYEVDFTEELKAELLDTIDEMRQARLDADLARSHNQPGKCAACGFREVCDESLM